MVRSSLLGATLMAGLLMPTAGYAVVIAAGDTRGEPGDTVELAVVLDSGGARVAGVQNDLEIPSPLRLEDTDACAVNPRLGKQAAFALAPCDAGPCVRLRAVVLAYDNVDEIPDGAVLYRCAIAIDADAAPGAYRVPVTRAGASDPQGNALPSDGFAGRVFVAGTPSAVLQLDDADVPLDGRGVIRARLNGFLDVAEVGNDITLSDAVQITSDVDDRPACRATAPGVTASFQFLPDGCSPGQGTCTAVRARVAASEPLPLAMPLYECDVFPSPVLEPGSYVIACPAASGADLEGVPLDVSCQSAIIRIAADVSPTPTRIVEPTLPTAATPTPTGAIRATATAAGAVEDDGCQVGDAAGAPATLLLLGGAAAALARRRGRR